MRLKVGRGAGTGAKIALGVVSAVLTIVLAGAVSRLLIPPQQTVEVKATTTRHRQPGPVEERSDDNVNVIIDWSGPHGVRVHPNVRATIRNHRLSERTVVIETNSLGLRHPELAATKSDTEFRVLVLGDSITFGDYVVFEDTYTAQLANRLGGRVPRVTIINAGLPGASTSDELYHYLEICDATDPDLVLVGMYLNDVQNSDRFYARSLPEPYASSRFLSWLVNRTEILRLKLWTREELPGIDLQWRERFRDGRSLDTGDMWNDQDAFDFEVYNAYVDFGLAWNPQSWEVLEPVTRTLVREVEQQGRRVALSLFPVHIQVKGTVEDFYPQERFLSMCKDIDVPCLDLVPSLRSDWQASGEELFFDHCHLTPRGNTVVADALARWLDQERLIPPPPK